MPNSGLAVDSIYITSLLYSICSWLIAGPLSLTHVSHCMTTSGPAAATQMTARVGPARQPIVFLRWMPFLAQPASVAQWVKPLRYGAHCPCDRQAVEVRKSYPGP